MEEFGAPRVLEAHGMPRFRWEHRWSVQQAIVRLVAAFTGQISVGLASTAVRWPERMVAP